MDEALADLIHDDDSEPGRKNLSLRYNLGVHRIEEADAARIVEALGEEEGCAVRVNSVDFFHPVAIRAIAGLQLEELMIFNVRSFGDAGAIALAEGLTAGFASGWLGQLALDQDEIGDAGSFRPRLSQH